MATLTTQEVANAGVIPTYAAAAGGGDRFTPGRFTFVHVKNGGVSSITVTITTPLTVGPDIGVNDSTVTVVNAGEKLIGPLPPEVYASSDGLGDISYSGVTSVTVAVFNLDQP